MLIAGQKVGGWRYIVGRVALYFRTVLLKSQLVVFTLIVTGFFARRPHRLRILVRHLNDCC